MWDNGDSNNKESGKIVGMMGNGMVRTVEETTI